MSQLVRRSSSIDDGAALATCQQIPPNFPGYEPYCPYTVDPGPDGEGLWTAPDFEKAQRLVRRSGTAGMPVRFRGVPWLPRGLRDYMVELLGDLGFRVSVEPGTKPNRHEPNGPARAFSRPARSLD